MIQHSEHAPRPSDDWEDTQCIMGFLNANTNDSDRKRKTGVSNEKFNTLQKVTIVAVFLYIKES